MLIKRLILICSSKKNVYNTTYTSCRKSAIFEKRHESIAEERYQQ